MKIQKLTHFCKFRSGEIGIADGYFAGDAWTESDDAFDRVAGAKFGSIDSWGEHFCDDRTCFSRPSEAEVRAALSTYDALYSAARDRGLVADTE